MFVEQNFDVLALSESNLKEKGEYDFGCEWKDVRFDQKESKGRSDLISESDSDVVCGGMERSVIKTDVGKSKV